MSQQVLRSAGLVLRLTRGAAHTAGTARADDDHGYRPLLVEATMTGVDADAHRFAVRRLPRGWARCAAPVTCRRGSAEKPPMEGESTGHVIGRPSAGPGTTRESA
jgi:ferric-dicitrate binding protein FerR (iron transport regulator)